MSGLLAVIFDTDGVLTDTASVHARAWKQVCDELLAALQPAGFAPFDADLEYRRLVDGRPRYDGAAAFVAARGIELPAGHPEDPPGLTSVCALGNRKDALFNEAISAGGVRPFPDALACLGQLAQRGLAAAAVSASRNAARVWAAAGLAGRFAVTVDGVEAERLGLAGKPDPALFLEAARRLGAPPGRAVVVEDALAGVEAGRRGRFGLVVGVARSIGRSAGTGPEPAETAAAAALAAAGADRVVTDLAGLTDLIAAADRSPPTADRADGAGGGR